MNKNSLIIVCEGRIDALSQVWTEETPPWFSDIFKAAVRRQSDELASEVEVAIVDDESQFIDSPIDPLANGGLYLELELKKNHSIAFIPIIAALSSALADIGKVSISRLRFHIDNIVHNQELSEAFFKDREYRGPLEINESYPVQATVLGTKTDTILPLDNIATTVNNSQDPKLSFIEQGRANVFVSNPMLRPKRLRFVCEWNPESLGHMCTQIMDTLWNAKYRGGLQIYIDKIAYHSDV